MPSRPISSRIITLTLNPAVDLAGFAAAVRPTRKIRTTDEHADPGGGGINVSRVLHALGADTLALIMTGGATGTLVEDMLDEAAIPWQRLKIAGRTRIALNVHDRESGLEYRFVPEGPEVTEAEWHRALHVLERIDAAWIVASGSLPRGVPADFYARAAAIAARRGQHFVLDTSGPALRASLGHGVTLLKVSLSELEYLAGRKLPEPAMQEQEIAALLRDGAASMIAVSLGAEGAVLHTCDEVVRLPALKVEMRSAVGAGDAFLAGMVWGLMRGLAPRESLALGIAAGSAAVGSYGSAKVRVDEVERLHLQALGLLATP